MKIKSELIIIRFGLIHNPDKSKECGSTLHK